MQDSTAPNPIGSHVRSQSPVGRSALGSGIRARTVLAGIVLAAIAFWGLMAALMSAPWIYVDELIYSDLAKSIAAGGPPAVRGVTSYGYGLGYPVVVAPAWAAFHDLDHAYAAARVLNALVMSLAAVPSYFLARRFVTQRSALIVAGLTVAVPSMVYATTIMTEVAFYPAVLLAILAIQRALDVPSAQRQLMACAAIGLAASVKILAIGLVAAYVLSALLAARGSGRTSLSEAVLAALRSVWVVLAGAAGAVAVLLVARGGGSPLALFGAYDGAIEHLHLGDLPLAFARHLDVLILYTAVIPVAATGFVVVRGLGRHADSSSRAFAALAAPTVLVMTGGVAVFASYASSIDFSTTGVPAATPVYERNLFVVVPLLLIGLAIWIESGCMRSRVSGVVGVCVVGLMAAYPWSQVPRDKASPQNLATLPWVISPVPTRALGVVVVLFVLVLTAIWLGANRDAARRLWSVVSVWFAVVALLSVVVFLGTSAHASRDGVGASATWIDRAVGENAQVQVVWPEKAGGLFAAPDNRQRVVWASEFFNRSVVSVNALGARMPFGLPDRVVQDRDGLLVDGTGTPVRASFVLAPCELRIDAPAVAVDHRISAAVYATDGIVRLGGPVVCVSDIRP